MIDINFNDAWLWRRLHEKTWREVDLPHDALQHEKRKENAASGKHIGWRACHDYEYAKSFIVPFDYADKELTFEFEGVYQNAEVYINGSLAASRPYGYTNFYVPATKYINFGETNVISVIVKNSEQPNSRWYSGAGIYRPVHLWVGEKRRIDLNGIKIKTLQIHPAIVEVQVKTSCDGEVELTIERGEQSLYYRGPAKDKVANFKVTIENAELWSPDNPALYTLRAKFFHEEKIERFGIRILSCSPERGFCINDERVILRGACVHHDNGILGARCYTEAEYRKVALLKEAGYNALRSAHNPCSKAMLNACDELGMLMVDEYTDAWYIHKTRYDYADHVEEWYERDLTDMIEKDYNHPSVIMYSLGNEVAESGEERGVELFKNMRDVCRKLDPARPVTAGINLFFNWLYELGFGVYTDEKAEEAPQKKVGSEFFNMLAGKLGAGFMKFMASLYPCDVMTKKCYAEMDVAGYNYGISRYKHDLKKYKNRVILGSETFCADAYKFYEMAKKYPALIGDFVWAGMDYFGEVGIGSWEYQDYADNFTGDIGWVSAGSGRLDLLGNASGEMLYTRVAFDLEDKPQIAVVPVNHTYDKHSPSAWKFSNAIPSWSWRGMEGKPAKVEVYSKAPMVELYVNNEKVGRKKLGKNCRYQFTVKYQNGEITAVNLDEHGKELSRNSLYTAGKKTALTVAPESPVTRVGELCFIHLAFTDENGIVKPLKRGRIQIEVEGGELLAAGHACPFNKEGYRRKYTDTYYGRAMAIVKATDTSVKLKATCNDLVGNCEIIVE